MGSTTSSASGGGLTRYAPDYFAMIRDFARDGRLRGAYGDSELTRPRATRAANAPSR
jgi:hypothetical protein